MRLFSHSGRTAAILGLAICGVAGSASAAVVRTNAFGLGADGALGNDSAFSPTGTGGDDTSMEIRSGDSSTNRNRLGIVRFDLSDITGDLSGANVTFGETGNNSRTVTVYGLVDGDAGENWDEATINYSTAPGISRVEGPPIATEFATGRIVELGTFGTTGSTNEILTFSGAGLESFLASDTNDLVTLYLYRAGGGSVTIRTKENSANTPPTLNLPNAEIIPEPGTLSLLAVGGVALLARRRRGA